MKWGGAALCRWWENIRVRSQRNHSGHQLIAQETHHAYRQGTKRNPRGLAPRNREGESCSTFGWRSAELTGPPLLLATSPRAAQPPSPVSHGCSPRADAHGPRQQGGHQESPIPCPWQEQQQPEAHAGVTFPLTADGGA